LDLHLGLHINHPKNLKCYIHDIYNTFSLRSTGIILKAMKKCSCTQSFVMRRSKYLRVGSGTGSGTL
jgi:hypothetical protein